MYFKPSSLSLFSESKVKDKEIKMIKKYFPKDAQVLNVMQMNTAGYNAPTEAIGKNSSILMHGSMQINP